MNSFTMYLIAFVLLIISFINDKNKTKKALKISYKSLVKLLPSVLPMMLFIGISLSVLNPSLISKLIGSSSGVFGIVLSLVLGSVAFIPSFVTFPLGANLLSHGAGYPQIAGFISALMAVGIVSLPIEIKYFSKKSAILRNSLGLLASIIFATIIWSVM